MIMYQLLLILTLLGSNNVIFGMECTSLSHEDEDRKKITMMLYAAANNRPNQFKAILDEGFHIDTPGLYTYKKMRPYKHFTGMTPLMVATLCGSEKMVNFLIIKRANLNLQNEFGDTPLIFAAENGHDDIVWLLVDAGADVCMQNYQGRTALEKARDSSLRQDPFYTIKFARIINWLEASDVFKDIL